MTIREKREAELSRLAERYNGNIDDARRIMNSFYKLCGLEERRLEFDNDERRYNAKESERLTDKAMNWISRLNKELEPYNCKLTYFGIYPTITEIGTTRECVTRFFY